ncbi:hypothetical protein CCMA1212_007295 [Trichoderma ghanense]|uniref:Uncharacterized protein n=1 Tax=Trichoderma ghanense TaxID=65468 RepID=A0ABY2GZA4_9HYPO
MGIAQRGDENGDDDDGEAPDEMRAHAHRAGDDDATAEAGESKFLAYFESPLAKGQQLQSVAWRDGEALRGTRREGGDSDEIPEEKDTEAWHGDDNALGRFGGCRLRPEAETRQASLNGRSGTCFRYLHRHRLDSMVSSTATYLGVLSRRSQSARATGHDPAQCLAPARQVQRMAPSPGAWVLGGLEIGRISSPRREKRHHFCLSRLSLATEEGAHCKAASDNTRPAVALAAPCKYHLLGLSLTLTMGTCIKHAHAFTAAHRLASAGASTGAINLQSPEATANHLTETVRPSGPQAVELTVRLLEKPVPSTEFLPTFDDESMATL